MWNNISSFCEQSFIYEFQHNEGWSCMKSTLPVTSNDVLTCKLILAGRTLEHVKRWALDRHLSCRWQRWYGCYFLVFLFHIRSWIYSFLVPLGKLYEGRWMTPIHFCRGHCIPQQNIRDPNASEQSRSLLLASTIPGSKRTDSQRSRWRCK